MPTYKEVSSGRTGHTEAVQVVYDPAIVSYDKLLDHYWHNVDPFVAHRQFCDVGTQYRPVIFFHTEEQRAAAESSKARIQKMFKQPIVVAITAAAPFYRAEEYHQDYYKKNSAQYRFYRFGCGRDGRLEEIWASRDALSADSPRHGVRFGRMSGARYCEPCAQKRHTNVRPRAYLRHFSALLRCALTLLPTPSDTDS